MGQKLADYYTEVKAVGGLKAQVRLAILTKIPLDKAKAEEDTPELQDLFKNAFDQVKKEFGK